MRHLFIVSADQPDLREHLAREFAPDPEVEVLLDRRRADRRRRRVRWPQERRRVERRQNWEAGLKLHTVGYTFVTIRG